VVDSFRSVANDFRRGRVCVAAPATSPSTDTTCPVPSAALATLREISLVAEFCCSTEAATAEVFLLILA
jgi:hypothetical protein